MFLQELKKGSNFIAIILLIMLLIIPFNNDVYHKTLYYIMVIFVLIPLAFYRIMRRDFLEKRFYNKWKERRKKGCLINILSEGIKAIINIVAVVFAGQYIGNGHSPTYILSELAKNGIIGLTLFLLIWGTICGILAWYEKEKKYERYYYKFEKYS